MRKLIALLLMIAALGIAAPQPASAQAGWCSDEYPERNIDSWYIINGDPFQDWYPPNLDGFRSAPRTVGVQDAQILVIGRDYLRKSITSLNISVWTTSLTENLPTVSFEIYDTTTTAYPPIFTASTPLYLLTAQTWIDYEFEFGYITSDRINLSLVQYTQLGDGPDVFYVRINRICFSEPEAYASNTPTPVTVTAIPTVTPQATAPNTRTSVPTWTRTPTRTRTPGTATPTKTGTVGPGTITHTPTDPYDWTPPPGLNSGPFPTPTPRVPQLRWELPVPVFMTPDLSIPTLIPARATSTAPSAGTAVGYVGGGSVIGIDVGGISTQVSQYRDGVFAWQTQVYLDAEGTPMAALRDQANLIANNIGGFFYVLRSVRDATGQIGDLVVVLLGLIAFNIIVRLSVFGIGLVLFLWRALRSLIDLVAKTPALLIMLVIVIIIIVLLIIAGGANSGDWDEATLTLTTPVATSTGTITATHTLLPISPTPTPKFRGFRMTPTPIPINTTPIFDVSVGMPDISGQTADQVINGYKSLNTGTRGAIDLLAFMALAAITIGMAVRLINRLNKDK